MLKQNYHLLYFYCVLVSLSPSLAINKTHLHSPQRNNDRQWIPVAYNQGSLLTSFPAVSTISTKSGKIPAGEVSSGGLSTQSTGSYSRGFNSHLKSLLPSLSNYGSGHYGSKNWPNAPSEPGLRTKTMEKSVTQSTVSPSYGKRKSPANGNAGSPSYQSGHYSGHNGGESLLATFLGAITRKEGHPSHNINFGNHGSADNTRRRPQQPNYNSAPTGITTNGEYETNYGKWQEQNGGREQFGGREQYGNGGYPTAAGNSEYGGGGAWRGGGGGGSAMTGGDGYNGGENYGNSAGYGTEPSANYGNGNGNYGNSDMNNNGRSNYIGPGQNNYGNTDEFPTAASTNYPIASGANSNGYGNENENNNGAYGNGNGNGNSGYTYPVRTEYSGSNSGYGNTDINPTGSYPSHQGGSNSGYGNTDINPTGSYPSNQGGQQETYGREQYGSQGTGGGGYENPEQTGQYGYGKYVPSPSPSSAVPDYSIPKNSYVSNAGYAGGDYNQGGYSGYGSLQPEHSGYGTQSYQGSGYGSGTSPIDYSSNSNTYPYISSNSPYGTSSSSNSPYGIPSNYNTAANEYSTNPQEEYSNNVGGYPSNTYGTGYGNQYGTGQEIPTYPTGTNEYGSNLGYNGYGNEQTAYNSGAGAYGNGAGAYGSGGGYELAYRPAEQLEQVNGGAYGTDEIGGYSATDDVIGPYTDGGVYGGGYSTSQGGLVGEGKCLFFGLGCRG